MARLGKVEIDVDLDDIVDRLSRRERRCLVERLNGADDTTDREGFLRRALEEAHEELLRHRYGVALAVIEAVILPHRPVNDRTPDRRTRRA